MFKNGLLWRMVQDLANLEKERKGNETEEGFLARTLARYLSLAVQPQFCLVPEGPSTCSRWGWTQTPRGQHGAPGMGADQTRGPLRAWLRRPHSRAFISSCSLVPFLTFSFPSRLPFSALSLCFLPVIPPSLLGSPLPSCASYPFLLEGGN